MRFQQLNLINELVPAGREIYPYLRRVRAAGGFPNYERAHLEALTRTLSPKFALPPELVRTVVEFYLHAGFYPFTAAKAPATAPAA